MEAVIKKEEKGSYLEFIKKGWDVIIVLNDKEETGGVIAAINGDEDFTITETGSGKPRKILRSDIKSITKPHPYTH